MANGDNTLKNLVEKIETAIEAAVTLKITTIVGDVDETLNATAAKAMYTEIDLVQGDIISKIDKSFLTEETFKEMRTYHQAREAQAHEIVQKNIETLERWFELAKQLVNDPADELE